MGSLLWRHEVRGEMAENSRMKEELPGTVLFSSSSPCWGSVWDWGTSGGFPTCVSRMGEVLL